MLRTGEVLASCRAAFKKKPPQAFFSHESAMVYTHCHLGGDVKMMKGITTSVFSRQELWRGGRSTAITVQRGVQSAWYEPQLTALAFHLNASFDPKASVVSLDLY